jgi:hypothetical protein
MAVWKKIGGANWLINPRKVNKPKRKHKGGSTVAKRKSRKHNYRPRKRVVAKTVIRYRYRNKPKRKVRRTNRRKHYGFGRRFHNPMFPRPLFLKKRHRRRHNPGLKASWKNIVAVGAGIFTPMLLSKFIPIKFSSRLANIAVGIGYGALAFWATKAILKKPTYAKYVFYGAVAGSFINIYSDVLMENAIMKTLIPGTTAALPSGSPASAGWYGNAPLQLQQFNEEIMSQDIGVSSGYTNY